MQALATEDLLSFADEAESGDSGTPWKLLIADDDSDIHKVTVLALLDQKIEGRPLRFLHAYSGAEAVTTLEAEPDIALVLLDVVMERETAGLEAVEAIRNRLQNRLVRIVLRTGQPGQAPEREIVLRYDINDYKEKTELTAKKLFTLVHTTLIQYRVQRELMRDREKLHLLAEADATVFRRRKLLPLLDGVLGVLAKLLGADAPGHHPPWGAMAIANPRGSHPEILATVGSAAEPATQEGSQARALEKLANFPASAQWRIDGCWFVGIIHDRGNSFTVALILESREALEIPDKEVVDLFCRNLAYALDNSLLHQQLERTKRELMYMLGEAVERRSRETGNHVRRVGEYSRTLARLYGLNEEQSDLLFEASPLHDVGKIAIPDAILNKPGRHTAEETEIMRTHADMGRELFSGQDLPIFKAAGVIAGEHHERWDGRGYPRALSEDEIHIFGRIVALADVFDALGSDRCYKKAWPLPKIIDYLREESGKHFDPKLVSLLLENLDTFMEINQRLADDLSAAGSDPPAAG